MLGFVGLGMPNPSRDVYKPVLTRGKLPQWQTAFPPTISTPKSVESISVSSSSFDKIQANTYNTNKDILNEKNMKK